MHSEQFVKIIQPLNTQASYDAAIKETPKNTEPTSSDKRSKRAVGTYSKFWDNGRTLTISFMEPLPDELEYRVEKIIRRWDPHHSLALDFVKSRPTDIRIYLGGKRNESYLGTDALAAPPNQPTLLVSTTPDHWSFECTLLHEFGHALGLQHEHLHPHARIPWNKEKVYHFYQATQGWSKTDIDLNLFKIENNPDTQIGPYDKKSIMHYRIPNELTHGNWQVGDNLKISEQDKINIRKIYPDIQH
jgi:hypothetical protein